MGLLVLRYASLICFLTCLTGIEGSPKPGPHIDECPTGNRIGGYRLFTRETKKDGECIYPNKASVDESAFDGSKPLVIFAHGYMGAGWNWYSWDMKDALLEKEDKNFIIVDWSKGSVDWLPDAMDNAAKVAVEISDFLKIFIDDLKVKPQDIHLIGHSMGGRVIALTSDKVTGTLGRLTALDPLPGTYKGRATFTDVIHTTFLADDAIADANFWPNNLDIGGTIPWISPHMYAVYMYTMSIKQCTFKAYECGSWQDFIDNKCIENPHNRMGHYASPDGGKGKMYLRIRKEPPFC